MKRFSLRAGLAGALAFALAFPMPAQPAPNRYPFPPADLMTIGAYYYPEAWPPEHWPRDHANLKKLGLEFVHMGEFAWAFLEPRPDVFDFDWLDRNIALAHAQGLKVVLCTPSPTPPIWLTEAHPEVLMVDAHGRRQQHGGRQHACWSVDTYRLLVAKIIHELGKRYGRDARVWGWQLDNELSHYGKEPCHCDACQMKFQAWLHRKYGDIAALNRDWGNSFWSQTYQRFDQIRLPNDQLLVAQSNPHQRLDARRWYAEEAADYLRFQTNILREYCGHRQWITTNHMHAFPFVDPTLNTADFDVASWTIYPVHGNAGRGPLGFRLGDPAELSFAGDFFRPLNGQHGIMELQPGQVNWGEVNPQPYPGAVYAWIMRTFATGADFVCTYRYRQPRAGAELYHYGLVGPDGVTPTNGGEQYSRAARDIAALRPVADPNAAPPAAYAARRTALLYSYENRWDIDGHKQNKAWDTYAHVLKYHRALKRLGAPVDVITEEKDFSAYPFLVAPAYQLVDPQLVARWKTYAENGGHLILSCRTGHKDRRGQLWETAWAAPIHELIGAKIAFYDTLPAPNVGHIASGDETHSWSTWADILDPLRSHEREQVNSAGSPPRSHERERVDRADRVDPLATYTDHFYAGRIAAITRSLGKGTVTYIGADSTTGSLEAQLVREVFLRAKIPVATLPEGVHVDWRDGLWIATNLTENPVTVPIPPDAKILLGTRELPPAGVTIWK